MSQQQQDNDDCIKISKGTLFQVLQREITNIGKALTCPICQSTYTNPVLLPCVHAFCQDCILSSFQHNKHECPCCKRPSQKRSIVSAAQGFKAMCVAYKHVVRDAALTAVEYDESCLAMTQIAPVDSSSDDEESSALVLPNEGEVKLHIQVGQTWLEQLRKSGDDANEVLKRQQEAVLAVDERVLRNLQRAKQPAHGAITLEDSHEGNVFLNAKETSDNDDETTMDETMVQDITTVLANQNLVKTPAAAASTTWTSDETCRRTNKMTTTTTTSSDNNAAAEEEEEESLPNMMTMTNRQETTSPARDESQQQYSESAAFYTADEEENKDTQHEEEEEETFLTAKQASKQHVLSNDDNKNNNSVPREVQVTFSACICETVADEQRRFQGEEQVRDATLPTMSEEAAGESDATGAEKEASMDVDGGLTAKIDENMSIPNATMVDAAQTEMKSSRESGRTATMPTSANKGGKAQREMVDARLEDARGDNDNDMSDANNDSVQDDGDEPMPDVDDKVGTANSQATAPIKEAAADTDDAGAVPENPSGEEEPMPQVDGDDDVEIDENQEDEVDPNDANGVEAEAAANLEDNEATPPSVSTFAVGTIVQVEDRCWPGINKQGGVGRITKVHVDGGSILYDVVYVLGGREKKVEAVFVSEQELDQKRNRSPPKSVEKANLSPELLASLAADGFDTEGKVRLEQAVDKKAGAKRKALDQNKGNVQDTTGGKKKRQRKGKTVATATKKKGAHHNSKQLPPVLTDDQKRENANAHYDERFQMAESQSIISVVASSLPEHEMTLLEMLCKETKNQDVKVRTTDSFNPSKTTFVVVAVDAKSNADNLTSRTRTLKVMRAILAGVPIVSPSWISSCLEAGKVISPCPKQYIRTVPVKTSDPLVNANLGVALLAARMHQGTSQLLSNVRVLLCGQFVSSEGSPRKADIQALLRESGATVFTSEGAAMNKLKKVGDNDASKILLLCDECPNNNRCGISTGLAKEVKAALERDDTGVLVVNSMWLFDSISCGQMVPTQPFKPRSSRALDLWKLCNPQ